MTNAEWFAGDTLGLTLPASIAALEQGGTTFLSAAFRASGAMAAGNAVEAITEFRECRGGSTGRKLLLSVRYRDPHCGLPQQLFVKFSRDFDDAIRDRAKTQLDAEVRLALLSRVSGFPIAVPRCLYADYHRESGSGMLITERIAFGQGGIEPVRAKCMDSELPDAPAYYRASLGALARLAAAQKSGRLAAAVETQFPFDAAAAVGERVRYGEPQLFNRLSRYRDFATQCPQLLPAPLRTAEFIARMHAELPQLLRHEPAIRTWLHSRPQLIALCHWNANLDNAWFWRDAGGALCCGLMDWGQVGQMSLALALFGALSAAETRMWNDDLDALLRHFCEEYHAHGGPRVDPLELRDHLILYGILMGLSWLMDAPAMIQAQIPDWQTLRDRFDPRLRHNETARVQLQMMTVVLNLWQRYQPAEVLSRRVLS